MKGSTFQNNLRCRGIIYCTSSANCLGYISGSYKVCKQENHNGPFWPYKLLGQVATTKGVVDRQEQGCFFAVFFARDLNPRVA